MENFILYFISSGTPLLSSLERSLCCTETPRTTMEVARKEEGQSNCGTNDVGLRSTGGTEESCSIPSSFERGDGRDLSSSGRSAESGEKKNLSTIQLAASYFPCASPAVATRPGKKSSRSIYNEERDSCAGQESFSTDQAESSSEHHQSRTSCGNLPHGSIPRSPISQPERPFIDPTLVSPPFGYLPEAVRDQWMQMFTAINNQPGIPPHKSHAASSTDEFEHSYKFQNHLAKTADERSRRHVKNLHKCVRNLVQMIGALEATYTTIRGCFYGSLCALEYGSHCWNLLRSFSIVRLFFGVLRTFWRYLKTFGQRAPLVGLLALLCTYVGRACLPIIQKLLLQGTGKPPCLPADVRRVKFNYTAATPDELSVSVGEEVVVGRRENVVNPRNPGRFYVKRLKKVLHGKQVGFIPSQILEDGA